MKMMKYMTSIATALFALVACSDADDILSAYHNDPNAVHINAEVGKASADGFTRSNPLGDADKQKTFNTDDEISVKAGGQDAVTYQFNGSEWIPQDGKFLKWENQTMNFTAYYPASYTGGTITQPTAYPDEASLIAADYMSFTDNVKNPGDNSLTLTMQRQMARVVVQIVGFNDQYDKNTPINSVTINGVKAYKHSVDNKDKYYALMVPCDEDKNANFLSLEVGTGNTETLKGIPALEAGKSYTYQLTVGKNKVVVNGITVKDWTTDKIINGKAELYAPYLTFTAEGPQKFKMTVDGEYDLSGKFEYSVNGGEWYEVVADKEVPFGGTNGTLSLRGTNPSGTGEDVRKYSTITFTDPSVKVACTGDIRALLNHADYKNVATNQARFCKLFYNCAVLTSAPDLPAKDLADECYSFMFEGCTSLKTAPSLPATKLAEDCYFRMFNGCESLETAPTLLAESLDIGCYSYMFRYCTNLKSAPELRATTLALCCYEGMFYGCTNLTSVTMLASSDQITEKTSCCKYWLEGAGTDQSVTSRTLIVKNADAYDALVNKSYLPAKWKKDQCTVKNESGTTIK